MNQHDEEIVGEDNQHEDIVGEVLVIDEDISLPKLVATFDPKSRIKFNKNTRDPMKG